MPAATYPLYPTEVPFSIGANPSVPAGVTVVGTPPLLTDGDDATYYQITGNGPRFLVMLPQLPSHIPPLATQIDWYLRASCSLATQQLDYTIQGINDFGPLSIVPNSLAGNGIILASGMNANYGGVIGADNYSDFGTSLLETATQLADPGGTYLGFRAFGSSLPGSANGQVVQIHEAWIEVVYLDENQAPMVMRLYPRSDGLGASTTPNLIAPRSQQSTNRVVGGYR